jgi:hypothetical protein
MDPELVENGALTHPQSGIAGVVVVGVVDEVGDAGTVHHICESLEQSVSQLGAELRVTCCAMTLCNFGHGQRFRTGRDGLSADGGGHRLRLVDTKHTRPDCTSV